MRELWEGNSDIRRGYKQNACGAWYLDRADLDWWEIVRPKGERWKMGDFLWANGGVPKWSFVAYRALKDRLPTFDRLRGFGYREDATCVLCGEHDEDVEHLFYTCSFSRYIWERSMLKCGLRNRAPGTLAEFGNFWSTFSWKNKGDKAFCAAVATGSAYFIWKERNRCSHGGARTHEYQVFDVLPVVLGRVLRAHPWIRESMDDIMTCLWGV